jgi:hypothetical protein
MRFAIDNCGEEIVWVDSLTELAFAECNSAPVRLSPLARRPVDFADTRDDPCAAHAAWCNRELPTTRFCNGGAAGKRPSFLLSCSLRSVIKFQSGMKRFRES